MENMIFNELKNLFENLSSFSLIKSNTGDGRIDSILNEEAVVKEIEKKATERSFVFIDAPPRYWYDCALKINNIFLPINVKITTGEGYDNVSSKEGLFYALTGNLPEKVNRWNNYIKTLLEEVKINDKDYYFLIYFKKDKKILFYFFKKNNFVKTKWQQFTISM